MREALRRVRLRIGSRGRVRVSRSVHLGRNARVEAAPGTRVVLHPGAMVSASARISALGGAVVVGPGARLGERAIVVAHAGVRIGAGAVIGDWAAVSDASPGFSERPLHTAPITIGEGAVLGPHAAVGASVAAGSEIAPYAVL